MADYRLRKRAGACESCDRPFEPGAVIVSTIREGDEGFERRDVCEACHAGNPGAFSVWRSRQPEPPEETRRLDYDLALEFLGRLLKEADPAREGLVFTLTLLLGRKRRVKIRETRRLKDGELLKVEIPGPEDDEVVQIRAPRLDEGQVDAIQAELGRLFDFGPATAGNGEAGDGDAEDGDAPEADAGRGGNEGPREGRIPGEGTAAGGGGTVA